MAIGDIKIGRVNQSIPNYISIRCDRKTPLGNPYFMSDETKRDDVCDKYAKYLNQCMNPAVGHGLASVKIAMDHIVTLAESGRNVLLQCHCYPKRCHTESIRSFVLDLINKQA